MGKYFVDFEGYVTINADSKEEAKEKFWAWISSDDYEDDCYGDNRFVITEVEED